ncbi:hypothetical protein FSHL1_005798 [Fusarium sambucinum]
MPADVYRGSRGNDVCEVHVVAMSRDDVGDAYHDKKPGVWRSEAPEAQLQKRRQLDRDPFDFGSFYAEIKRLMPQFVPKRIFYTGVTNLSGLPIV